MKYIFENAKLKMEYLKFGKGSRILVILPGVNLFPNCAFPMITEPGLKEYSDAFTCYLFDRKENLEENATVESIGEDTATVMKELGLKDVFLFGASFGGMIAQMITLNHPELVSKLFLASTMSRNNPVSIKNIEESIYLSKNNQKEELIHSMIHSIFSENVLKKSENALFTYFMKADDSQLKKFSIEANSILSFDVYERLPEIKCPIMIAGCSNDLMLSSIGSIEIHEKTGAPLLLYGKEYSHNVYDEAPDFKTKVVEFFSEDKVNQ